MSDPSLDEDVLFELLGNNRRRECLKHLRTAPDTAANTRELARHVAETIAENPDPELERSIYTTLCQTHLPKLDACDVVDYDQASKCVSTGPAFEAVRPHIDDPRRQSAGHGMGGVFLVISLATVALLSGDLLVSLVFGRVAVILLNLLFLVVFSARYARRFDRSRHRLPNV